MVKLLNHINTYQSKADYQNDKSKNFPNVSYIVENDNVLFVKEKTDYSNDYLTFVALEDSTFKLTSNAVNYSLDDGQTWTALASGTASPTVTAGNKIMWKGELTPNSSIGIGKFSATANFNVQGNIMSLLFGDDFTNKTDLTGKDYAFYNLFYQNTNIKSAKNLVLPATKLTQNCYQQMFRGCTSLETAPTLPATKLASGCYYSMFEGCTSLTTAPTLPATKLANYCYYYMFRGCTGLVNAPTLPATKLANSCYGYMFSGTNVLPDCSNIDFTSNSVVSSGGLIGLFAGTKVTDSDLDRLLPKNTNGKYYLPATTLADNCYQQMFQGCKSLTTAPELPATTLADNCYQQMFQGCKSLTTAPELPATTLANYCYYNMFSGCTSLTTAPELPATTLANSCYSNMFQGCKSLTTAPVLPATTLASGCYDNMFSGCTGLTTAPELPATTLANYCYYNMFSGCTGLTTAPELPATTLADSCYGEMFYGCTSLTTAPELPATTLADNCYYNMFNRCTKLNYIKCLATDISASNCLYNWVRGVASSGKFVKAASMTSWTTGVDGIPTGWTVQNDGAAE